MPLEMPVAAPAAVSQPRRGHVVDSHLVMNVLNQLAAHDYSERGEENPLLFALSDYLRDVFLMLDHPLASLAHEARLMEAHATLVAQAMGVDLGFTASAFNADASYLQPGTLTAVAGAMLKAAKPAAGTRWQLALTSSADPARPGSRVAMVDLSGLSASCEINLESAQLQVQKLNLPPKQGEPQQNIVITQDRHNHLRATCQI